MNTKRHRFPLEVKRGSSVVKIYRDRKPAGTYYRVTYHIGGKRERLNFNDLPAAINEAEAKATQLSRGDIDAMQLSGKDRLIYGRALEAIKDRGAPLDAVALEYAQAYKILDGTPLLDAARFYMRHYGRGISRKAVSDAVREMIETKSREGVSEVYLNDLRYRLGVFRGQFHCDLVSVTAEDVRKFLDGLNLGARSLNNFLSALKTFFRFAQDHQWLSKETNLLSGIKRRKEKAAPVEIFSPRDMAALMQHATPEIAPCLALGAFAGLRSQEILRLEWTDVTRRPGFIEIAAHKSETATRRLVPIAESLERWLTISQRDSGLVWSNTKAMFYKTRLRVAAEAGVKWRQNCIRHSWASYRLAETQDVNRVALEAGNSPQMIFRHYRELATPEQARSWFSIGPPSCREPRAVADHACREMSEQSSDIDRELEELQKRLEPEGRFFPRNKLIPLTEAVVVADKIASRLKVTGYKTEELLRRALRAEDLAITVQGFAPGKTGEDWVRSLPAEESNILQQEEMTSESAIEELFNRRVQRRRRSDRDRKRRKTKSLIKNLAKSTGKERKTNRKKRKDVS